MNRILFFAVLFFAVVMVKAQVLLPVKEVNRNPLSKNWNVSIPNNIEGTVLKKSSNLASTSSVVTKIYTDFNGFFTSASATTDATKQPDTENNLLAFDWNGKTWATGVDNAVLTSKGVTFEDTKFRALKIFDIQYNITSTYFLQGAMMDGSLTNRILTPPLIGSTSTPAELAARLTDGKKGLSLGTGIANIKAGTSQFKIGTGNINISGVGDGKPDIIISQVAQPDAGADVFKFVDVNGNTIGNTITISFPAINAVGSYRLDLFKADNGVASNNFQANETRDIRMLGYDFSDFGINASNEASVDRLVITFSGSSDCAFIGVNEGSLKRSELSLVKTASLVDCGKLGDTITYSFVVKNSGDVPLTNIKLRDLNPAVVIPTSTIALLAPGATATLTGTYVITAADVALGKVENSAEVVGEDPSLSKVTDISGTNESNNVPTVIQLLKTWTGTSSTDWNVATNWSPNGIPTASDCVVIPNVTNKPIVGTVDANANTLQVNATGVLTVNSLRTLSVVDKVTVVSGGKLVFENNASLVQINNVTNTGTIEYNRSSSLMKNFDFTYWSSPVAGQNIVTLSPNTLADKYFRYDPASGWVLYNNPTTSTMIPGAGYIIRVPKPGTYLNGETWSGVTPYAQPVTFKGVPNNGDVTFTVGPNQYNLVGNPYPSAIDATKFMKDNSGIIYGPLYFWTHNTPIANNIYTANDYATFNITGGTGTATAKAPSTGVSGVVPNGFIAAGQSFFVGTKSGIASNSSFKFTNTMRVSANNTQFFKQTNTKKSTSDEKNRVWLNLTNAQGAFKQLLVGYITGATNDYDNLYDGPSFDGQPFVDFYSINQGQNLTIQGRALPFEVTDVVPLGYRSTIAGPFEIGIDSRDGVLAQQELWLEDKKTSTVHDLTKGSYTFTTIYGVENDRFVLKYTNKTLGTEDNIVADKSLLISIKNKKITITSSEETMSQIQIFDLLGRKIYDKAKINAQEYVIDHLLSSEQTLIVKTTLAKGVINSQKIIF
ncbi:DUF7507 domain-containing protein [Flavobacterium sp. TSSA_36]|uniref:DUF7507 domain-containing protein n=1 Tax=Flavobacterium sp. TSSA_36 TaxID=3447669 RepID=UPI003F2F5FF9